MFSIHDFIMKTLRGMVGSYPDFQVREYALNWYGKGKLNEEDLATAEEWLTPVVEAPVETAEEAEDEYDVPVEEAAEAEPEEIQAAEEDEPEAEYEDVTDDTGD